MTHTIRLSEDYLVWRVASGRTVEICDIAVLTARRKGQGTQLLETLRNVVPVDTSLIYAITRWSNTIAQQFYEARGFVILGRLHNFYVDGPADKEHGVVYGLYL